MRSSLAIRGLVCAAVLALAGAAQATPINYTFTGGQVHLTGTIGAAQVVSVTLQLNGDHVTFDAAVPHVTDVKFNTINKSFPLSGILSGLNVTLASLTAQKPVAGFTLSVASGTNPYNYTVGPIDVFGVASLGTISNPTSIANNVAFGVQDPTLSGVLNLSAGNLTTNAITLGSITANFGGIIGTRTIVFKGDFVFTGLVPEPGTGLLLGSGIAALAAARRHRVACS